MRAVITAVITRVMTMMTSHLGVTNWSMTGTTLHGQIDWGKKSKLTNLSVTGYDDQ